MVDLRSHQFSNVISRVQGVFGVRFDTATEVRKRRSLGFRTDRDTWVRIEVRELARIDGQGWNGVECATVLAGIAKPAWHQGVAWLDADTALAWRADETELIRDPAIKPGGILTTEPELSELWWATYNASLDALAASTTTRIATPGLRPITQQRFTDTIHQVFPEIDPTITEWSVAHGDLAWANLTAPNCFLLDWEDWGLAPRGLDAATLWSESLALPELAERVRTERRADLDSQTGQLTRLFCCAKLVAAGDRAGPLLEPAKVQAAKVLSDLGG
jgi:hypothetical protein